MIWVRGFFLGAVLLLLGACSNLIDMRPSASSMVNKSVPGMKVADVMLANGNLKEAARIYHRLLKKEPKDAGLWLRYSRALYMLKSYEQAAAAYENYAILSPENCEGFIGQGQSNLRLGRAAAAGPFFEHCLSLDPENIDGLTGLAISHDMADRADLSHIYYQKAISANPNNRVLINNYALSLLLSGKYESAINEFSKIAFGKQSSVKIRQNLALAYGLNGDAMAAEEIASLDLHPDAVENNLRFFEFLRHLPGTQSIKSVLLASEKTL